MEVQKISRIDLGATLSTMRPGDSVTFTIAGDDRETSYTYLHTWKSRKKVPMRVTVIDNGMRAVVTRL